MIEQQNAKNLGIKTTMPESETLAKKQQKLEAIKAILPEAVNADNGLNIDALKTLFGAENMALNNQGYSLNFAGKGLAKAQADTATKLELRAEHAQSKNFDETQNMIIRGDNIDVLKILRQNYTDKIKMIYIDPPYNTKNDDFIYKDNFKQSEAELIENLGLQDDMIDYLHNMYGTKTHSGWLAFIYPRLKLARDLLTDDGVIFISIDDNEQANLKIICDEIFGSENFVGLFPWRKRTTKSDVPFSVSQDFEWLMGYAKFPNFRAGKEFERKYYKTDDYPNDRWRLADLTSQKVESERKNSAFNLIDPKTKKVYPYNPNRLWGITKDTFESYYARGKIVFPDDYHFIKISKPAYRVFESEDKAKALKNYGTENLIKSVSTFLPKEVGMNEVGNKEMLKLFDNKIFSYPKPVDLIKYFVEISTDKDSIILDFFAGSGTTADAVMQMNAEDGGNRKFILAQLDEEIDKKQAAYDFCTENNLTPFISSICIERVNRAGDKIKTENAKQTNQEKLPYENLGTGSACDIGYKVFSLTPRPKLEADEHNQITLNTNRQSVNDKLYNMLAASCKILTLPITSIEENILYEIDNAYYLLAECKTDLSQIKDKQIYIDGYSDIKLENWLNTLGLDKENITIIY